MEERRAIGGVLGTVFYEEEIRFSVSKFEQGLQKTRFGPVELKAVLEVYFGETLSTNQGQKQELQKKKQAYLEKICDAFMGQGRGESAAASWIRAVISSKRYGYQILMREYGKDPAQAEALARNVGNALRKLESIETVEGESLLAVFAAEVSGNPHYFDRGTVAGQLLVHAISYWKKAEFPQNAHEWRELLLLAGIVPDNVSSMLHAYGLRLRSEEGWHPAYDAFCTLQEPYVITMENLRGITGVQAKGERVYVVENEMVFSYLVSHVKDSRFTLLCTSGQLRFVALEVIRMILESGTRILYSGDIDPDGIGIADRLWQKFGDGIQIWRMSPEDYEHSLSGERIGDLGIAKLEAIKNPLLRKTVECMKPKRMAAYQENILEDMRKDLQGESDG